MPDQFKRSYETQALIDALSTVAPGSTITYAALSEAVGMDVSGTTAALRMARIILARESQKLFATERKVGVRRLTDTQIVQESHRSRSRIGRESRRAIQRLACVQNFAGLSEAERQTHQAHAVIYGMIADAASHKTVKALQSAAVVDGRSLLSNLLQSKAPS